MSDLQDCERQIIEAIYRNAEYRLYGQEAIVAQRMARKGLLRSKTFGEYKVTAQGRSFYERQQMFWQNHYGMGRTTTRSRTSGFNCVTTKPKEVKPEIWIGDGVEAYGPKQRMVHSRRRFKLDEEKEKAVVEEGLGLEV